MGTELKKISNKFIHKPWEIKDDRILKIGKSTITYCKS